MLKQTIIWTTLPNGSNGPVAAGTKLSLSVFVSPRLWEKPEAGDRKLKDYPDFLDWPQKIIDAKFSVSFNGGVPLPAEVVTAKPVDPKVWTALFNKDTRVVPFRFESLTKSEIVSPPSRVIHDTIKGVYQRAATDPAYGGGKKLPPRGVLAANKDLKAIAWPTQPLPKAQHIPDDPTPIAGKPWVPDPLPVPEEKPPVETAPGCCGCGCLAVPFVLAQRLLRRLTKLLGFILTLPVTMGGGFGGSRAPFGPERFASDDSGGVPSPPPPAPDPKKQAAFKELYRAIEPTSKVSVPMPSKDQLEQTYDFHQMVSTLGDYPILLRYCGLVLDLQVTLDDTPVAASGTVRIEEPSIDVDPDTVHHRPVTHYDLEANRFLAAPDPLNGDLRNGLLRVEDVSRFDVLQLDVAGGGIKLQTMATSVVSQQEHDAWAGNEPEEQGLPALQTAGLSLIRIGFGQHLHDRFLASEALNNALAKVDGSEPGDPAALERSELFAEDLVRGYRVDVWDDKSTKWHSLCRRVGTYELPGMPLKNEEDEGFVQASAIELVAESLTRVLRVHESLFTWNGWSLGAPRYGNTILPDPGEETKIGTPPNEPATQFELKASFTPKEKSLPRLRFGYQYKLRVRAADLAGNSVFGPENDIEFQKTPDEVTAQVRYRRFEPVLPPMMLMQAEPVEGESLERLVVRSTVDADEPTLALQQTARHLIPPKTSQMMAEQHRKFDRSPAMKSDDAGYTLALREAGSLNTRVKADGTLEPIPEVMPALPPKEDYWLHPGEKFELTYLPDPYARGVLLLGLPGMASADTVIDGVNRIIFNGEWPHPEPFRLLVQAVAAGPAAAPVWVAADRLLTVQVPQGETWPVRISSILNAADLDNMAIWSWVEETGLPNVPELRDLAVQGPNWLHLPFRTLVLVHAVQQPLIIPAMSAVTTTRSAGDTLADLHGSCIVDAKSTEKIDVHAEWSDPIDDLSQPKFTMVPRKSHVDQVRAGDPTANVLPLEPLQHAVGDTKYHAVTYRAIASTRFREYFPEAIWSDPKNITRPLPSELDTPVAEIAKAVGVDVLSTARPDAPKLQYILPLFRWTRTGQKTTRRGGRLRIYLERPWFSSGEGELVGITLRPPSVGAFSKEAETLRKYTSEWGMDPLWPAAATEPLTKNQFVDPLATLDGAPLAELEGRTVDVVGYRPEYDEGRQLWYCDVTLDTAGAYFPMLRLALVRFQPKSVDGVHISPVVLANFIQTVPHREVRYDFSQLGVTGTIQVEVEGPAYIGNQNDPSSVPQMILRLEERSDVGATDELGWQPLLSTIMTPTVISDPAKVTWAGDLTVATPPAQMRIVVLEVEGYFTDQGSNLDHLNILDGGASLPGLNTNDSPTKGYRVTFADAREVP